jgi:hypothetical protein
VPPALPGALSFEEAATLPPGSAASPASGAIAVSDSQPVMVLPDLAGWPSMSVPVAAELPMLAHRRLDGMDGVAHLLPGARCGDGAACGSPNPAASAVLGGLRWRRRRLRDLLCASLTWCLRWSAAGARDVGSATHDGALACAALGPLPACCSVGPPSCAHSTFEAGALGHPYSFAHFPASGGSGHSAAGMLPQLCAPPSSFAVAGTAGVHANAGHSMSHAPASQPFVDQVHSLAVGCTQ